MADRLKTDDTMLYLYGITQRHEPPPATLRGVDAVSTVEAVECSGFTCWLSRVDAAEYGEKLTHNMENLEWLAGASVRHQRVVGAIHERQPILPARFGTVFVNQESLDTDIRGRKAALKTGFRRIADADEWGIRVFAQSRAAPVASNARTGKEYLQRKSALLQAKPIRTLEPQITHFASAVGKLATASAQGGKVASGQPGLRWQTSILLPRSRRAKLHALVESFARQSQEQFRVECTGPWPPYSFVGERARSYPGRRVQKERLPDGHGAAR